MSKVFSFIVSIFPKQVLLYLIGIVIALVLGYILYLRSEVRAKTRDLYRVALVADSTEAANAKAFQIRLSEDRIATVRRVVQAKQYSDSLEKALGLSREANFALLVSLRSFQSSALVVAEATTDSGLAGTFNLRQPPYTITASVRMVPAPRPSALNLKIDLDTLKLGLRIGCGKPVNQIRPATVIVEAPPWAAVGLPSLEQSPEVCQYPSLQPRASGGHWATIGKLSVLAGLVFGTLAIVK